MEAFLEILKYTVPALIVLVTAVIIIKRFFDNEEQKRKLDLAVENEKMINPIRLQAYERLILFLERISPESLVMRVNKPGLKAKELQTEILAVIRAEYEHNLAQQVYVSSKSWEILRSAKANLIKIINQVSAKIKPDAPSIELSKALLETIMEMDKQPTTIAIEYLKKEVRELFF
jgi:hypothetical protein